MKNKFTKNTISLAVAFCLALTLSACMNGNDGAMDRGMNRGNNDNVQMNDVNRGRNIQNDYRRQRTLGDGDHRINNYRQDSVYGNDGRYHQNSRLDTNEELARAIADLDGIDYATVMLTDNNAYVGIRLDDNDGKRGKADQQVSEKMKEAVGRKVRQLHPQVENVYVSANAGFIDRMDNMIQALGSERPVRGIVNEFNSLVERIFPENK